MQVPDHYKEVHRGFWGILEGLLPDHTVTALPSAADRYLVGKETVIDVFARMLGIVRESLIDTANLTRGHA